MYTMKPTLNPYLAFQGNCREAMEFYKSVLGGELTLSTFGEGNPNSAEDEKNLIMHALLDNGSLTFMASDGNKENKVNVGNNISMSISGPQDEEITKYFNGLAVGGKVELPLEKAPWGDKFGMLTDKFGINWMMNISAEKPANANS